MKSIKIMLALAALSAFVFAGCSTTQRVYDDYGTGRNPVYVEDPYYGNIILQRDPYTGRYYEVTNGYRIYRVPNNYRRHAVPYNRSYQRRPPVIRTQPARTFPQIDRRDRQEARDKVLGRRN